ncbi:MAG: heme biosynthesis protein HemY [Alphaproteobacteria bacterium]|nr:heme biosynthesis protein HemY [Alphaproteobacteria bacterium]
MRRLMAGVAVLVGLALLGVWMADQPGRIVVDAEDLRIEAPTAVGVGLVVLLFAAGFLLHVLWRAVRYLTVGVKVRRARRQRDKGERLLSRGMVAVAAGDRAAALGFARQAEALLPGSPLSMLLSAQSAQLAGDEQAMRLYYGAMLKKPETEFLGLRGLAMQAHRLGHGDEALNLARRAYRLNPGTPWVLTALFDLEAKAGHWREVERVTERALAAGLIGEADARRRRAIARYEQARTAPTDGSASTEDLALASHRADPGFVPAAVLAAALAAARNRARQADQILTATWQQGPHDALARSFLHLHEAETSARRLARAERLTAAGHEHLEARLLLTQAALAAGQVAKARSELAIAAATTNDLRVLRLMAAIDEAEPASRASAESWRRRMQGPTLPEAWRCTGCGHRHDGWQALCQQCGAFDTLHWVPPTVLPAANEDGLAVAQRRRAAPIDDLAASAEPVVHGAAGDDARARLGRAAAER